MSNQITERHDMDTGEILTDAPQGAVGVAVQIKTEIEAQVDRARRYPRGLARAQAAIHSLVMLDEQSASECVYALPRGGKPIKGPSVRFAEIVASQYGNCHVGSRVVAVDRFEKVVIAEGVFIDYETGLRITEQTQRRIVDRNGRLYNDDMIVVTGNAARSIAARNAVLKGVPKPIWAKAYQAAERVIAGDVKTLAVRRVEAIAAFAVFGVKPEQLFAALEIDGAEDIGLDEIGTLIAMHRAIKSGESTVEDFFAPPQAKGDGKSAGRKTADKLRDIADGEDAGGSGQAPQQKMDDPGKNAPPPEDKDGRAEDAPDEQAVADAKAAGINARRKGRTKGACPYKVKTPEGAAWLAGWEEAEAVMSEGGSLDDA